MNMISLRVHDILTDRILISRESARQLESTIRAAIVNSEAVNSDSALTLSLDFNGVEGIAPSFLDELVSIFDALIRDQSPTLTRRLIVANPPTRLSSKFEAIGRSHGLSIQLHQDGSWLLTDAAKARG